MLHFSFSTVLMALFASAVLTVLTGIILSHGKIMICTGYKFLMALIGIGFIRLLFPFEFPFTINVALPDIFSRLVILFRHPVIYFGDVGISLWHIFELIWIAGIGVIIVFSISHYRRAKDYLLKYGTDKTADKKYRELLDMICREQKKDNLFRVIELPSLNTPVIFGIKNPCILLPQDLPVPSDKLYYILYHEAMHHFRRSFLIKGILHLFSTFYWWNPVCTTLYKYSNVLSEMLIDSAITRKNPEIVVKYTECLLYMRAVSVSSSAALPVFLRKDTLSFMQKADTDLKRRVVLLLQDTKRWKRICLNLALTLFTLCLCAASYLFIFEANYNPPLPVEEFTIPTSDNMYCIMENETTYKIYIHGQYIETVSTLEYYPAGIKIYNKEGVPINED